jgi:phage shock protein C
MAMHGDRLYRSWRNRWIAGVCGGLGEHLGIDPLVFRIGFVLAGPAGLILYMIMAATVPEDPVGHGASGDGSYDRLL